MKISICHCFLVVFPCVLGKGLFFEHFPVTTGRNDDLSLLAEKLRIWEVLHDENEANTLSCVRQQQLRELLKIVGKEVEEQGRKIYRRKGHLKEKQERSSGRDLPEITKKIKKQRRQQNSYLPKLVKVKNVSNVHSPFISTKSYQNNIKLKKDQYKLVNAINKELERSFNIINNKEIIDFASSNTKFMTRSGKFAVRRKKIVPIKLNSKLFHQGKEQKQIFRKKLVPIKLVIKKSTQSEETKRGETVRYSNYHSNPNPNRMVQNRGENLFVENKFRRFSNSLHSSENKVKLKKTRRFNSSINHAKFMQQTRSEGPGNHQEGRIPQRKTRRRIKYSYINQ